MSYIEREALMKVVETRLDALRKKNGPFDHYTDGYDECVDTIMEQPTAGVVAAEKHLKKPLTNFDRIKAMSVEELADVIYRANDDICFSNCQKGTGDKFCCPYGNEITNEQCIACVKKWLESEVEGE